MSDFSLNNYLFGPLDIEFCLYFYILSIINFIFVLMFIGYLAYSLISINRKTINFSLIFNGMLGCIVLYFQNRLLFSMCSKSEGYQIN